MKKVLMIALMLVFFVGTASATTYMGLFVSETDHDGSEDCTVTVDPYQPYNVYLMVNADAAGFTGFQISMDQHSGDFQASPPDHPNGGLWMNSEFSPLGVAAAGFANMTGWNVISIMHKVYAGVPHEITIGVWPGLPNPLYIDGANVETPLAINTTPFGVNIAGVPANESSWGAVKSLYR